MNLIAQNFTSVLLLSINLLTTLSYFIVYSNNGYKKAFAKLPMLLQKIYVAFFVLPLFLAPFFGVSKFAPASLPFIIGGSSIALIGFLLIILSFLKIGVVPSIKHDGKLSTTGVYKIVRHPIYFGTIVTQLGLSLANQSVITLLYLPISTFLYYVMATIEERDLVDSFGDEYKSFQKNTKGKVIPLIL
jgi:protein-S-isoprenylcysteine O-methyltransferase Ste14